jgi:hypothetical protein
MLYDHCYVSNDFMADLREWADTDYYEVTVLSCFYSVAKSDIS